MIINFEINRKISNSEDALHCVQAAFSMAVESLSGAIIDNAESERLTGFSPGVETWPYRMLAWFGENGYEVVHIDALDAPALASDPRKELLRSGFDAETIDYFFQISDFHAEAAAISRCINSGVVFEKRLPKISDIASGLQGGWLPIIFLDASVLTDEVRDGYQGHVVLVTGFDAEAGTYLVQDSGPPPHWDWEVPGEHILKSMRTPADSSGTVTLVRSLARERRSRWN